MYAATGGPNVKWGPPISNGEPGTTGPPAGDGLVAWIAIQSSAACLRLKQG